LSSCHNRTSTSRFFPLHKVSPTLESILHRLALLSNLPRIRSLLLPQPIRFLPFYTPLPTLIMSVVSCSQIPTSYPCCSFIFSLPLSLCGSWRRSALWRRTRSRRISVQLPITTKLSRNSIGAKLFALTHALGQLSLLPSGDGQ
jgi:hypothetical protein